MIRRPPRSTLFPTRRSSDLSARPHRRRCDPSPSARRRVVTSPPWRATRSEEHTSELQSRRDLVCRLLLEKKKSRGYIRIHHSLLASLSQSSLNGIILILIRL